MRANRIPSKTFLLGEYSVLKGGPALVLCTAPYFIASGNMPAKLPFHPESAAGKLWSKLKQKTKASTFQFKDSHIGRGGFGASGAEFISIKLAELGISGDEITSEQAWNFWKEFKEISTSGSGVDVLAQSFSTNQERNSIVYLHPAKKILEKISIPKNMRFFLLHTGMKLATHEHLAKKIDLPWKDLEMITASALKALRSDSAQELGTAIIDYRDALQTQGYLAPHSLAICKKMEATPGVIAAKGCGAMGSDVVLVLGEKKCTSEVEKICQSEGLELVASI